MSNINFDNIYLLFILIPLAVLIVVPFCITVRRDNVNGHNVTSLIAHVLIAVLVVFAIAGTKVTTVMTKTEVYVVADVSYSANKNLDEVDGYVRSVKKGLPENSKMGLVCFGKDAQLLTPLGGGIKSVKQAAVDDGASNICGALEYASGLFGNDAIKRLVLITDGGETSSQSLKTTVDGLNSRGVFVDAIYLDDNIKENQTEVQISSVEFAQTAYKNHETFATVFVQSNTETRAMVTLTCGEKQIGSLAPSLSKGVNPLEFPLPTDTEGAFDYKVKVEAEGDGSAYNNEYSFTQVVSGTVSVLLITSSEANENAARELYGENAEITAYTGKTKVPFTVDDLCVYDEIMLVDTDIRTLENYTAFIESVDTVVSMFGKSLVTIGDCKIQNRTDDVLKRLEDMLPVRFGNNDKDPRLLAVVLDSSRSMFNASRFQVAKAAAVKLIEQLDDNDMLAIYSFAGDVTPVYRAKAVGNAENRAEIIESINALTLVQGTVIGAGLQRMYEHIRDIENVSSKQVMLISDGKTYRNDEWDPVRVAATMFADSIPTSTINPCCNIQEGISTMRSIAQAGGGTYYYIEREEDMDVTLEFVVDDISDTVIEKDTAVNVERENDEALGGMTYIPYVSGYVYAKAKSSATTPLTVNYQKMNGEVKAPLYSYWNYGNGKVSSFTSALCGDWVKNWRGNNGERFLKNVLEVNTPQERVLTPYNLDISVGNETANLSLTPASLDANAKVTVKITPPQGEAHTGEFAFADSRYIYNFTAAEAGRYAVEIDYFFAGRTFNTVSYFNISYSGEYDEFAPYNISSLHRAVTLGKVFEKGDEIKIENDHAAVATYTLYFTVPFLIAAVALFVADIVIRKLRWKDIKSLFGKTD